MSSTFDTLSPTGGLLDLPGSGQYSDAISTVLANGDIVVAGTSPRGNPASLAVSEYSSSGALLWQQDPLAGAPAGQVANVIALSDGDVAVAWMYGTTGAYAVLSSTGQVLADGAVTGKAYGISGYATPGGGFVLNWQSAPSISGGPSPSYESQAFDAKGAAVGAPTSSSAALTGGAYLQLADGAELSVQGTQITFTVGNQTFTAALPQPQPEMPGPTGPAIPAAVESVSAAQLQNGNVALSWVDNDQSAWVALYNTTTHALSSAVQISSLAEGPDHVVALPDGGFVVSLQQIGENSPWQYEAFDLSGTQAGGWVAAPTAIEELVNGDTVAGVGAHYPNGPGYLGGSTGATLQDYTIVAPASPTPGLNPAAPVTLSSAAGWTSAAVLSNGDVAAAAGPDSSGADHVQIFDASGNVLATTTLQEFAGASPTVTALAGGFWEATYANTSDVEIFNAQGQEVFVQNAWTNPNLGFTALTDGGYLVTNSAASAFGFVGPSGNTSWLSIPADAPAGGAASFQALQGGSFAITYAGSTHFDVFDASGHQTGDGDLSASVSSFATAIAATANGGFAKAWLSADGGQDGLPSALDVQTFDTSGASTGVVTVTQDLDPWHTQIQLQAHADGSAAVLWSQGGAIWASEVEDGAASAAVATGVTGALSHAATVQLPNDEVGFAFLQNGQVWADILNPATGAKQLIDLGAATGDISSVHALATADGGMAVSWHDGTSVMASMIAASGSASAPMAVSSDFLGIDMNGHAAAVADNGSGVPVLQGYLNNSSTFWHA